jgi:type I restriction enzyme S subunit
VSELPIGWSRATLEEISGVGGLVSDGDWIESKDQDPDGSVRLIQLMDVGDGHFTNRSNRFLNEEAAERLRCTKLRKGDVLIARMPDPLGRACVFPGVGQEAVTAVDVLIWRAGKSAAVPEWLKYAINSPDVREDLALKAGGTTRQRVAGGVLKKLELPVPPLAEQRRIVEKLDALTARMARARADLDRVPSLTERFRKASVQRLIVEAGSRAGTVPAGDLFQWASGKFLPKSKQRPGAVPVFGGNGINGRHDAATTDFSTLVVGRVGAQCGNVHITSEPAWITDNAIFAKHISPDVDLQFALYVFQSANLIQSAGGTGQPYVNQDVLNEVRVPAISLQEQQMSAVRIGKAFAEIDRLSIEAAAARRLLDRLERAVLAKAFCGELVPQNPTDEPVSVLIDRIRAERGTAPKTTRGRKRAVA